MRKGVKDIPGVHDGCPVEIADAPRVEDATMQDEEEDVEEDVEACAKRGEARPSRSPRTCWRHRGR